MVVTTHASVFMRSEARPALVAVKAIARPIGRRSFVCGLAVFASSPYVHAQPARIYRIGVLSQGVTREYIAGRLEPALSQRGYEIGHTIVIEYRLALNDPERLGILGAELVAAKVDLIVAPMNPDVVLARRLTSVIPIVMLFGLVPVEVGLVQSLAHPGGNVTGTTVQGPGFSGKFLELLRDTVPNLRRVALMWEPDYSGITHYFEVVITSARSMGLELIRMPVRSPDDLDAAFSRLAASRPDALFVSTTGVINSQAARVIESIARLKVPAIYGSKQFVTSGGLMSYTANQAELISRHVAIVDRILKGANPAEVPVEEPTKFELVINLKTARALGLVVPPSVLLRADEVIS
jgi:putative ABC transport system substrate-binding protein